MTRKLTFLILALFALISGPGWGQTSTYTKATSLQVGDEVVLVCETAGMEMTGISTTSTKYGIGTAYTDLLAGTHTFTVVAGSESGSFSFKIGDNYLRWNSGNSLDEIATSIAKNSSWTISFDESGNATILNCNDATRQILWNKSSPRFACYAGQSVGNSYYAVQLYKKQSTPSTDPVINAEDVELAYDATSGEIAYAIENPVTGKTLAASTEADWISNIQVGDESVIFSTTANTTHVERTATITLSYTGATSKDVTVTQAAAPEEGLLFYESFDTNNGTGGNDGQWSGSIASNDLESDNENWTFVKGSGAKQCAKFGTGSAKGSATTPSISYNGDATLTFKAAAWDGNSEGTTLNISATSGTLSQASVTLVKGAWTEYSIDITNVTNSTQITFEANNASNNRFFLDEVKVLEAEAPSVATPTFNPVAGTYNEAQSVSIVCANEGAAIYYTLDGTEPSNSSTPYTEAITINETTTVKAIAYVGNEASNVATATYTILTPLTTMDEIFAAATEAVSIATDILVTFDDWVISGVKNDNAYLTDGTKGLIIYESDHGFEVGDILTGTVSCKVQLYQGSAELIALTSESEGLTVTEGGSVYPVTMTIDQITSGVYTGAVITIENVTYNSSDELLSDGTNTIKPYDKLYSDMSFTNDKEYNVTGVYLQYNNTKEIMPRNAEDIYLIPATEYNIELIQPLLGGGTISADKEKAAAGETVTLTATPFEHYHLYEWKVLYGTVEEVTVTNNQFTMPASDVMIFAYFAEDDKYNASYNYNGEFHHYSDPMYAGPIGTLYDPTDMTPPAGFSFVGWSTSMASTEPIDETYTISSDIDLYAIFEKASTSRDGSEVSFVKVTEAPEDWSGEYLLVYEGGENTSHVIFPAVAWTGVDAAECGVEVNITSNTITGKPEAAATLTIAPMEDGYSIMVNGGDKDGQYIGKSNYENGLDFAETAQLNTIEITNGSAVITAEKRCTMRYNYTNDQLRFRYYKSGQQPVQLYKKSGSTSGTIGRYTRVYDDAYPASGLELFVEGPSIVVNGYILDATLVHNDNAANLIIEDGAQLKSWFEALATVQKNITGYGEDNVQTRDGYYLIANPTATVANDEYDALEGASSGIDVYTFDPTEELEWRNQAGTASRIPFTRTVGYLFASAQDRTMSFRGSLLPADETTEINLVYYEGGEEGREFPGFNLIGNPYACNAYPTDGAGNFMSFYKMNEEGEELELVQTTEAVAPCEGFFIEADYDGQQVTMTTEEPEAAYSALCITVSQNRGNVIDRAIVNFNGNNDLHKFMLNPAHTNISLAKNGEEFAAVSTSSTSGELPVNFKAAKNGTYTITVNAENVDAEYLHLIDNKTGMDVDLLASTGSASYTFEAKTSDYASRFKLVFGVNNADSTGSASNFAYMSDGNLVIDNIEGEATLQIVDELGRVISTETVSGSYNKTLNLKAGLYILNLNGMTQKIVVK